MASSSSIINCICGKTSSCWLVFMYLLVCNCQWFRKPLLSSCKVTTSSDMTSWTRTYLEIRNNYFHIYYKVNMSEKFEALIRIMKSTKKWSSFCSSKPSKPCYRFAQRKFLYVQQHNCTFKISRILCYMFRFCVPKKSDYD